MPLALLRVAPEGRLRHGVRTYQALSALALLLVLVPFLAGQLRIAIYPQLEAQGYMPDFALQEKVLMAPEAPMAVSVQPSVPMADTMADRAAVEEIVVTAARQQRSFSRYAPNAIVQVGPGRLRRLAE